VALTHTGWPLKLTEILSATMVTGAMPTAARVRPQFGSEPNMAHLNRLSRPRIRAATLASASVSVPVTVMATRLVTPSASAWSCLARSMHTAWTAVESSSSDGVTPDAPLAMRITVSLVEVEPSMSMQSKETSADDLRYGAGSSTWASVVSTTSMVASDGAIMPTPLAMPPRDQPSPW
jgi:hypothetical protein